MALWCMKARTFCKSFAEPASTNHKFQNRRDEHPGVKVCGNPKARPSQGSEQHNMNIATSPFAAAPVALLDAGRQSVSQAPALRGHPNDAHTSPAPARALRR